MIKDKINIWVDDLRPIPKNVVDLENWIWLQRVEDVIDFLKTMPHSYIGVIDLDHDAGDEALYGGDYIEILKWLEEHEDIENEYYIRLHTMNVVGRMNMENIIKYHDNWKEVKYI